MMMKLRKILFTFVVLFTVVVIYSVDMDFGIFNYNGSRLKKIVRWFGDKREIVDQVVYDYDNEGYLKSRKMYGYGKFNKLIPTYVSEINYDLEKRIIYEKFNRFIRGRKIPPAFLEYYYDENNRLVNYKRKDGNTNDDKIDLSRDVEIRYNEKGDIIFIKDHQNLATYEMFFPGEGLGTEREMIFNYEYKDNLKIRYEKLREDLWEPYWEFKYDEGLLKEMIRFLDKEKNEISYITEFKYDKKNNITETIFDLMTGTRDRNAYFYDENNRLVKRILYSNYKDKENIRQIEEYYYEDGPYKYYPYLLPSTKIKIYITMHDDPMIDKSVF